MGGLTATTVGHVVVLGAVGPVFGLGHPGIVADIVRSDHHATTQTQKHVTIIHKLLSINHKYTHQDKIRLQKIRRQS
jgi:hypothetical protein